MKENVVTREFLTSIGITVESLTAALATTHRGWLCEIDDRIVGFAIGNRGNGELEVIAVLPECERKGIGRRLMTLVQDWLWSEGYTKLWLVTGAPPTRAYNFYAKLGWSDVGATAHKGRRLELHK
ncbi:MAG: GNAT family N-acetyltransferase [Opitutales bacterium]